MDKQIIQEKRAKKESKSKFNSKKLRKKKSNLPCGACILITILSGDDAIIKAYFFSMYGKNKQRFPNMRRLGQRALEMAAEDICHDVYTALYERYHNDTLQYIKYPKTFLWNMVKYKGIDKDKDVGRWENIDESENGLGAGYAGTEMMPQQDGEEIHEDIESELMEREDIAVTREVAGWVLEQLTPFERFLICLNYVEELQNKEIAELLDVTQTHGNVILFNLRKRIKRCIWGVLEGLTPFEHYLACLVFIENVPNRELAEVLGETEACTCIIVSDLRAKVIEIVHKKSNKASA